MHQDVLHYLTTLRYYYILFKKKRDFLQHPVQYSQFKLLLCSMSSAPCTQFWLFPSIKVFLHKCPYISRLYKCAGSYRSVYPPHQQLVFSLSHKKIEICLMFSSLPLLYPKYVHSLYTHNNFNSS